MGSPRLPSEEEVAAWYDAHPIPESFRTRREAYGSDSDRVLLAAYDLLGEFIRGSTHGSTEDAEVPGEAGSGTAQH